MKQGWEVKKLGEVCQIVCGGTPDTNRSEYWDGDNLWITPKDMGKLQDIYIYDTERKITDAGLSNSSAKKSQKTRLFYQQEHLSAIWQLIKRQFQLTKDVRG
jgi:restriction endonuclease S subunit